MFVPILDYLITYQIYKDNLKHNPGKVTDLRSALVNNITFAYLAVKNGFQKYLKHMSPLLNNAIDKFINLLNSMEDNEDFDPVS